MQSQNKMFEDLSRMATGAMGTLAGMGREIEQMMRERMKEFVGGLDLVSREEFEAVKAMAASARAEADALRRRLDSLEGANATASVEGAPELDPTAEAAHHQTDAPASASSGGTTFSEPTAFGTQPPVDDRGI